MRWHTRRLTGKVSELQERSTGLVAGTNAGSGNERRAAVVQSFADCALVLGSAQPESTVDVASCAAAGVEVVRRRSGGGAVLVEPGSLIWVDLVIRTDDPLWSADVGRSTWWVGEAWARALGHVGLGSVDVWKGPMVRNHWSPVVCFAGLGPGEVVDAAGRKVVGISQRRTRLGALFQCACALRWEPDRLISLLALAEEERGPAANQLAGAAVGVGAERAGRIVEELLTALP